MQFKYFQPRETIRRLVSSYYDVFVPEALTDIMRAEIANIRVILSGHVEWDLGGKIHHLKAGDAILCGPTFSASPITFESGTRVFGMAVTPLGWARMFDQSADSLADIACPLEEVIEDDSKALLVRIFDCADESSRVVAVDDFMESLAKGAPKVHTSFLEIMTDWLVDPDPNELGEFLSSIDLSHRQVDRLCRTYFGASPKKLHRKFRALHSANRLTWKDLTDWRDIATTSYYDQSHFIREFKQFNGRTPSEFIKGAHILVRLTLQERLQIVHESPFSLVG